MGVVARIVRRERERGSPAAAAPYAKCPRRLVHRLSALLPSAAADSVCLGFTVCGDHLVSYSRAERGDGWAHWLTLRRFRAGRALGERATFPLFGGRRSEELLIRTSQHRSDPLALVVCGVPGRPAAGEVTVPVVVELMVLRPWGGPPGRAWGSVFSFSAANPVLAPPAVLAPAVDRGGAPGDSCQRRLVLFSGDALHVLSVQREGGGRAGLRTHGAPAKPLAVWLGEPSMAACVAGVWLEPAVRARLGPQALLHDYQACLLSVGERRVQLLLLAVYCVVADRDGPLPRAAAAAFAASAEYPDAASGAMGLLLEPVPWLPSLDPAARALPAGSAASLAVQMRRAGFVARDELRRSHSLSGAAVFDGKSLSSLVHPNLPVAVVL